MFHYQQWLITFFEKYFYQQKIFSILVVVKHLLTHKFEKSE